MAAYEIRHAWWINTSQLVLSPAVITTLVTGAVMFSAVVRAVNNSTLTPEATTES